jgi:exopolyphosphatase / guanosine-5'-triphosphate,3'-diphosphate pyrophosphatase
MADRVAAIDLGTNTFLMLVARRGERAHLEVELDLCRTPRLGQGLAATGALAPQAIERGLEVLREFAGELRRRHVAPDNARAVGTAALRRARNARTFVERALVETGIRVEVIAEEEEARLGYHAVVAERTGALPWVCRG